MIRITAFGAFCTTFLLAATAGVWASGSSLPTIAFFCGVFALAIVLQSWISGMRFFEKTWNEQAARTAQELDAFIFCGARIEKNEESPAKVRFWQSTNSGRTLARVGGIAALFALYVYWRVSTGVSGSYQELVFVLAALAIVFSSVTGHFFIALAFIWLPLLWDITSRQGELSIAHGVFALLVFCTLIFEQIFRVRFAGGSESSERGLSHSDLVRAIQHASLLMMVVAALSVVANFIVPEENFGSSSRAKKTSKEEPVTNRSAPTLRKVAESANEKLGEVAGKVRERWSAARDGTPEAQPEAPTGAAAGSPTDAQSVGEASLRQPPQGAAAVSPTSSPIRLKIELTEADRKMFEEQLKPDAQRPAGSASGSPPGALSRELAERLLNASKEGVTPEEARRIAEKLTELKGQLKISLGSQSAAQLNSPLKTGQAGSGQESARSGLGFDAQSIDRLQKGLSESAAKALAERKGQSLPAGAAIQSGESSPTAGNPTAGGTPEKSADNSAGESAVYSAGVPKELAQKLSELERLEFAQAQKTVGTESQGNSVDGASAPTGSSTHSAGGASAPTSSSMHSAGGANAPTGSSTHSASGAAPSERAPDKPIEPTAQPSPKPSPKPLLSKPNFEALWSTLRFILILGASFLIFVLLQKLFEKVDPSKVRDEDLSRVLSQDEKAEFRKRLKELDSAKLSAEEEVIRRYHLLLEILASAGHARKDSEPPVLYSRKLSRSIPFLASPIQGASLSFSDVLYGKLPVEGEQLKQYRLRVDQVARQFL